MSVTGADNTGNNPEIQAFLQENVEKCTEFYTGKKVKNEPELQPTGRPSGIWESIPTDTCVPSSADDPDCQGTGNAGH